MKKVLKAVKNIVFSCLFFCVLFNTLVIVAPILRDRKDPIATGNLSTFYAEDKDIVDVVCVGSSALYRCTASTTMYREYGITMLNYATADMPFQSMCGLVDEILEHQSPKVLVLEVRSFIKACVEKAQNKELTDRKITANNYYVSVLVNNMPISINRAKVVHDTVPSFLNEDELEWQIEYLKNHNNWKNLSLSDINYYINNQILQKNVISLDGKYSGEKYKGTTTVSKVTNNKDRDFSDFDKTSEIPKECLEILQKLVDKAKSVDTQILFLSTPYPATETRVSYENALAEYIEKYDLDYLNCNKYYDEIGIDFSTDFYDNKHTNTLGAVKTTKYLGQYLIKEYNLQKSELTEEQAKEWQEAADLWYSKVYKKSVARINKKAGK